MKSNHSSEPDPRETFPWGMPGSYSQLPVRRGSLRGDFSILSVQTDAEAVGAWIAEKASRSSNTAESYRREAERLMLWASEKKNKALSELMREDFLEFAAFLSNPAPTEHWISEKRHPRSSPKWRPFMGPLSSSSSRQTQVIVGSLFRYLHRKGWIKANPIPNPVISDDESAASLHKPLCTGGDGVDPLSRSLTQTQWAAVQETLDALPCDTVKQEAFSERSRWLLTLFHHCGPRVSEVCSHQMGSIKPIKHGERTIFVWIIMGQAKKLRAVPLSRAVVVALTRIRAALGLSPYPTPMESIPLAPSFSTMKSNGEVNSQLLRPLTRQSIYGIVTEIMASAANRLGSQHPEYDLLRRASTHWLRHTALKDMADNIDDIRHVQQMAGLADIKTTMVYSSAKTFELHDLIEHAREKAKNKEPDTG